MLGFKPDNSEADPRVAIVLSQLEIQYEIGSSGDYKFVFDLGEGRSQMGIIRSQTHEFMRIEIREILSIGLRSFGIFNAPVANILLQQNEELKIGAWGVVRDAQENYLAVFTAKVAADLKGEELMGVIGAVLQTADEMEKNVGLGDVF
jgi:serine protease Do